MTVYDVVIGASRKELRIPVQDLAGNAIDVTGSSAWLNGISLESTKTLNAAGSVLSPGSSGYFRWTGLGALVTAGDLGARGSASFTCEVKFTDASGTDYSARFGLKFIPPLV